MSYVITRTNGKVVQVWEDNDASWDFFLARHSKDVKWRNVGDKEHPKIFKTFQSAVDMLQKRGKLLGPVERKNEADWQYHVLKESTYVDDIKTER